MIATVIIVSLAFIWLGYETDWMRVRLPYGEVIIMRLPSGVGITAEDLEFIKQALKPVKTKPLTLADCWYCGNGAGREHVEAGVHSFDLCECGASIVIWSKRKARKQAPYAKLGAEINAIMKRNYNPAVAARFKTKAMI